MKTRLFLTGAVLFTVTQSFAKDLSKQQVLDRARASEAATICDSKQDLRKCLKSDSQDLCGQIVSDAFSRCLGKLGSVVKEGYSNQDAATKDLLPVIACSTGHFGVVAKEKGKWSSDEKCKINVPPGMQIQE